ncbi:hypothetical protein QEN19_001414 [Hanseniaspora menglaensis]
MYNNNNRYNNTNKQHGNNINNSNNITIKITGGGINPQMNGRDFTNFIFKKTRYNLHNWQVPPQNQQLQGQFYQFYGEVNSKNIAQQLCSFSGMLKYNNINPPLRFEQVQNSNTNTNAINSFSSNTTSGAGKVLNEFVMQRYNPTAKMLNLSNYIQDPVLQTTGLLNNTTKLTLGLLKIVDLLQKNNGIIIETLDLSGNGFKDLSPIKDLPLIIPNLVNLSLSNNMISRSALFGIHWKNKFKKMRELILINNPMCSSPSFQNDLMSAFPKLILLDSQIIRDETKVNTLYNILPGTTPVEAGKLKQFFFESEDISSYTTQFLGNFFKLWDDQMNRNQLISLYQQESQFSISVDSSIPPASIETSDQHPNFNVYNNLNRNLNKLPMSSSQNTKNNRIARLYKGNIDIGTAFNQLPSVKHFLIEDPTNYSIQNVKYSSINGMVISIHGYFEENGDPLDKASMPKSSGGNTKRSGRYNSYSHGTSIKYGKKSFDRTICLIPGDNGIPIIVSDLLNIRSHVSAAWNYETPKPITPPSSASSTNMNTAMPAQNEILIANTPQEKEQLCLKVQQYTKLNQQWAIMLCEQSNWNYELAIRGFNSSVGNIPPTAYQ